MNNMRPRQLNIFDIRKIIVGKQPLTTEGSSFVEKSSSTGAETSSESNNGIVWIVVGVVILVTVAIVLIDKPKRKTGYDDD
jgi:hypothetical protein